MRNWLLVFTILLLFAKVNAQEYKYQTILPKVENEGFYKIQLASKVTAKLQSDFSDFRIVNEKNLEVPYILTHEIPVQYKTLFREYEVIERQYVKRRGYTRIVVHNSDKKLMQSLSLIIRNSDVSKWLKINGTDDPDRKDWFALRDNYYFHSFYHDLATSEIKILDFPKSNYEYYEIVISDFFNKPIQVQKVGYYDTKTEYGKYSVIKSPDLKQSENESQSIITFNFDESQYIDKLIFDVDGADFFYRPAKLYVEDFRLNKKNKKEKYERYVTDFHLNSSNTNNLKFDKLHGQNFTVRIENFDDQPLHVKKINALQLRSYAIAQLTPEQQYKLKFGNSNAKAPVYDIRFFQDSIPPDLPVISAGIINPITETTKTNMDKKQQNTIVMWSALAFIMLVLVYMSSRMIRDMSRKGKTGKMDADSE